MKKLDITPESNKPLEAEETAQVSSRSAEDIQAAFVREIVAARHSRGLSQKKLQFASGVQQAVITRLETGFSNPKLSTIIKILHALDMKLTIVPSNPKHGRPRRWRH